MVASNPPGRDPIVVQERGVYSGQNQGFQSQIVQGNFNTQGGSINIINNVLPGAYIDAPNRQDKS